jgi:hypothetical protein
MLTLIYCFFAALCGWIEAILYGLKGAETFKTNEHIGMTCQRIAAALLPVVSVVLYRWTGEFWILLELVPAALLFPAVHDESYNFTRLWASWASRVNNAATVTGFTDKEAFVRALNEYKYGYQSPTTTARNDFNGKQRTWLAMVGFTLLLMLYAAYFFLGRS